MVKKQVSIVSREGMEVLKGVAILAVLGIHLMGWSSALFFESENLLAWSVGLDQVLRYCVPLFVLLSGLGLSLKYSDSKVDSWQFWKGRVTKILPRYVFWSAVSFVVLSFILTNNPINISLESLTLFLFILIGGKADYHYYFIPMIFQLYLVFPVLLNDSKRFSRLTMWSGIAVQFVMLSIYWVGRETGWDNRIFYSDYLQYYLSLSWLGYFVVGLWLARQDYLEKKLLLLLGVLTGIGLAAAVWSSLGLVSSGEGLIMATAFTRVPVMIYALGLCGLLVMSVRGVEGSGVGRGLAWLGKYSFLLYLCHVLYLRVLFGVLRGGYSPIQLVVAGGLLVAATILYVKWFKA